MIKLIRYINPMWFYNLKPYKGWNSYFPDYNSLTEEEKKIIDFDPEYKKLSMHDASYQAFMKGIIKDKGELMNSSFEEIIPVSDYYRFLRKYYHLGWSIYFLLMRIFTLNNPLKEFAGFFKSLKVQRIKLYPKIIYQDISNTQLTIQPLVSIILPTLNRYGHLENLLRDISKQTILPFEIIIADQSDNFNSDFYKAFQSLPIKIIRQANKGQWLARNEAIKVSRGDFILLVDDDSRVQSDWIETHLKGLIAFSADISAGVSFHEGKDSHKSKNLFRWAEEFDSGNAMVKRSLFYKIGLFDNAFNGIRMGDTEFGLRAYLNGFKSISNPIAFRKHIETDQGGMRYWGSKDPFRPISLLGARPDLGVLILYKKYFDKDSFFLFLITRIYISFIKPSSSKNILKYTWGFIKFVTFSPIWILKLIINLKNIKKLQSEIPSL